MLFLFLVLPMAHAIRNLTHAKTFDFRDTTYADHSSITYLYGKHCADSYMHFDHETYVQSVDFFKNCLDNQYGVMDEWFVGLQHTFDTIYKYDDYEWGNISLLDSEIYKRYRLYSSVRHNLDVYKSEMISAANHFSDPVQKLGMATEDTEAIQALNQSAKNVADMKESVDAIIDTFRASILSNAQNIKTIKADLLVAENLFKGQENFYVNNVTDVLRKLCTHPTALYDCAKGYYCTSDTVSTGCPAGTFQPSNSMTAVDACIQCPLQTYSTGGAANCTSCASNHHMGATACHLRSLGEVIATMDTSGPIRENFYIAFDMARQYITATSTLLNSTETATAAAAGSLGASIQALVSAGSSIESAYETVLLGVFQSIYSTATYTTPLAETDFKSVEVVAQTDLTKWAGPYIDGSTNYNLTLTANTWAVYYVDGTNDAAILSGTRDGKTLTGGTVSTRGMIEFPVSSALAYGYPVVSKDGTPIHSYQLK